MFIHDSLSELVVCGETEIVGADIRIAMNQMMRQVAGDTNITELQKEFQVIFCVFFCLNTFESCMVYGFCLPLSLSPLLLFSLRLWRG